MEQLFQKAVIFSDSHFGRNSDSPIAHRDNLEFLAWMIDRAQTWGADTCLFLGDYFHSRISVGVASLQAALTGLEMLSAANFKKCLFLKGNHDIAKKHSRDIASVNFARHLPNIKLINQPCTIDDVTFLPWLVEDEHLALSGYRSRYVLGHLETIGAMMNAKVPCTGGHHAIEGNTFQDHDLVVSGHFHSRQFLKNDIIYCGNICPFDFSDENDDQKGAMFLSWGHDPFFESWPGQPLYRALKLSQLIENPDRYLKQNMTVRLTVDLPMRYEEAQELRDALVMNYGLRKLEMLHNTTEEFTQCSEIEFRTVDQIVVEGLSAINTTELSTDRLIDIYKNL